MMPVHCIAGSEAVSKVKIRPPFSFAGSAELQLGIFKDLKSILHFG
jgi:hypothetical protein